MWLDDNYDDKNEAIFLDPPRLTAILDGNFHLKNHSKVNVRICLERNRDAALLVYKIYHCESDSSKAGKERYENHKGERDKDKISVAPSSEPVPITPESTYGSLNEIARTDRELAKSKFEFKVREEISAPYL